MKKFLFILPILALLAGISYFRGVEVQKAEATFNTPSFTYCHNDNGVKTTLQLTAVQALSHLGHGHQVTFGACPSATPSPSETPYPSSTPNPCIGFEVTKLIVVDDYPQVTPCPSSTPESSATPSATPSPQQPSSNSSSGSPSAPQCPDVSPTRVPANFHVYRGKTDGVSQAIVKWLPDTNPEGNQVTIYYGVSGFGMQHSVTVANTGYFVINLYSDMDFDFWGQVRNGCGGGPLTKVVIDGASSKWVLFTQ